MKTNQVCIGDDDRLVVRQEGGDERCRRGVHGRILKENVLRLFKKNSKEEKCY